MFHEKDSLGIKWGKKKSWKRKYTVRWDK